MPRRPNTKPTSIYWLIDTRPETIASGWPIGKPFYCGKTIKTPEERLSKHRRKIPLTPKRGISIALNAIGEEVVIRLMEVVPVGIDWCERERHWIRILRHLNPKCVNSTDGGDGAPGYIHTAESLAKLRGRVVSEDTREKLRVAGKAMSKETRAKISAAAKALSEETRERMRAGAKSRPPISEETRSKISAALRARPPISEQTRAKLKYAQKGKTHSEQSRAAMSAAQQRRHARAAAPDRQLTYCADVVESLHYETTRTLK